PEKFKARQERLKEKHKGKTGNGCGENLGQWVVNQMLPTPTVNGNHNKKGLSKTSGNGLATVVALLPSPQSRDYRSGEIKRAEKKGKQKNLNDVVGMLPTPTTQDGKNN